MAKNPEIVATIIDEIKCSHCGTIDKKFGFKIHIPKVVETILEGIGAGKKIRIDIFRWYKKRSLSQNSWLHVWCSKVEKVEQEFTAADVKCLCKLNLWIAILRGDDPEYNDICETVIDPLPYPDKIKAMMIFPVTSLMNTDQLNRAMVAMHDYYLGRVELKFPDEFKEKGKE